jgi:hypothetical protein
MSIKNTYLNTLRSIGTTAPLVALSFLLSAPLALKAKERGPLAAGQEAGLWMAQHPLFLQSPRELGEYLPFPGQGDYSFHVFRLLPKGYLVLNSDDRLPLALAFSTDAALSLEDVPENAFRAFLVQAAEETAAKLAELDSGEVPAAAMNAAATSVNYPKGDFVVGPWLESSWNQNDPYNYYTPADPSSAPGSYYDGRVPIGCVPLAYAQLLYYHRWPLAGTGSSSYTDSSGSTAGPHSAVFSDSYAWDLMASSHSPADSEAVQQAVGELVYELAVAVEADFESSGTSSSINFMRNRLIEHFKFEPSTYHGSYATLQDTLDQDILDGYPGIFGIPGHAVVADGLMRVGSDLQYRIDYGWGGTNNGWFAHDAIPGGGVTDGVASLRPQHIAIPGQSSYSVNADQDCEIFWTLPKRRNSEVDHIRILQKSSYTAPWSDPADNFNACENVSNWSVVAGFSGNGWYAGPNGPAQLDLTPVFVPDGSTQLQFRLQYRLGTAAFRVLLSDDGGESYTALQTWSENYPLNWEQVSLSLAAYAGQEVRLRLELLNGSFYSGSGGVWVDELSVTGGSYQIWETFIENPTQELLEFSSSTTRWEDCDAFDRFSSTSTSPFKDWALSTVPGIGEVFYKEPGGYTNREYHLTSSQTLFVPDAQTRLSLHLKTDLATDGFRILASVDGSNFGSIGELNGFNDWGDRTFDLSDYAGQSIYLRLEYLPDSFFPNGGVWVDSISLEQSTNLQYEQQPIHKTTLTGLAAGDYTLAAQVVRTDGGTTPAGPAFTLTVADSYTPQGTPYSWLIQQGLAAADASAAEMEAAALSDPTGKGNSVAFDYVAGTDPNDRNDRLAFSAMQVGDPQTTLEWTGALGRWYQILHSTTLEAGSWNILTTVECTNDDETLSTSFPNVAPTNFLKISVTLEEPIP